MDAATSRLRSALQKRAGELRLAVVLTGLGSVMGIAFSADTARHEDAPSVLGLASLFHLACASEGVLIGPGGILAVSTAHDEAVIGQAIERIGKALETMAGIAI
jgi:glutamate-1-semialdehyde aminotransferase